MSSKQRALVENVRGMIDKGERGAINAPRTEEFVVNSRGSRLHVRSDWTKAVRSLGGIKEEDQGQESVGDDRGRGRPKTVPDHLPRSGRD